MNIKSTNTFALFLQRHLLSSVVKIAEKVHNCPNVFRVLVSLRSTRSGTLWLLWKKKIGQKQDQDNDY